jgi:hypothetical protein
MSWIVEYFDDADRQRAEQLATAEREARASGKELFDLARFEQLLDRGPQAGREADHRVNYYLLHPELRTLAEYAARLIENEPWEDAR